MLANLRVLFGVVVDIILFRRGPESMPASQVLLAFVVVLNVIGSLFLGEVNSTNLGEALLQAVVGCAVMLAWFWFALAQAQKQERFMQMMTATFAVNALFLPAMIPMLGALMPYLEKADPATPPPAALLLLTMIIAVWALVVQVRIVRATFECPWAIAVLLVVGEILVASSVSLLLFGGAEKAA